MAAAEVPVASVGWLAGSLAIVSQAAELFERSPMVGFISMGLLGALAGFALLMEQGKYDDVSTHRQIRSLVLRLGIGVVIGVGAGVLWDGSGGKPFWLIGTVVFASAPIDMFRVAVEVLTGILRRRAEK